MDKTPRKNSLHDNRNLDDHKGGSFTVKGKEGDWHGQELEATSDPLIDAGMGKERIIRFFEFAINPGITTIPTKQEIFNSHWRQISALLWSDGLVPMEEIPPRVLVGKRTYKICIVAKPRMGVTVADKARTLQDILKK